MPYRAATDPHKVIPAKQFSKFFYVEGPATEKKKSKQTGAVVETVLNLADKGQKTEVFTHFIN